MRPWRDVKRAAIAAHASQRGEFDLDDPAAWPPLDREWYRAAVPPPRVLADLYEET